MYLIQIDTKKIKIKVEKILNLYYLSKNVKRVDCVKILHLKKNFFLLFKYFLLYLLTILTSEIASKLAMVRSIPTNNGSPLNNNLSLNLLKHLLQKSEHPNFVIF